MSIYGDLILDHYRYPRNNHKVLDATAVVEVSNPLCGDQLQFSVKEKNSLIEEIGFIGTGCAISQAAASMLTEYAKGKNTTELLKLDKTFMIDMLGIELSPNRLKCALLALEALQKVLK